MRKNEGDDVAVGQRVHLFYPDCQFCQAPVQCHHKAIIQILISGRSVAITMQLI